ncbi:hypothetical protein RSAG8_00673, partial [Rhizoctonia solani AG-8 WAC10335]
MLVDCFRILQSVYRSLQIPATQALYMQRKEDASICGHRIERLSLNR